MKKGILIFAHNNRAVDYALMATIAAGLAKKHLGLPVSLVTDASTISWCKESGSYDRMIKLFDQIIEVDRPVTDNMRNLHDGIHVKSVPFVNSNRSNAYDLSPYDKTLLIDSDYLIFSDRLNSYWDVPEDVMISTGMLDIYDQTRLGYLDKYVSETGVHMYWATNVMFTKSDYAETFFNLVDHIRENYKYYADLFRFSNSQFRNDIAFSVAKHILDGFSTNTTSNLPPVLTAIDKDVLYKVDENGKLTFLISPMGNADYFAVALKDCDIHIMNKQSIIRHYEQLEQLI
jgi:hypothetical protein